MELDQVQESGTQRVAVGWDEDGEPKEGFIIVGKDSDEYQRTVAGQRQRAIRRQAVKRTRFDLKTEEGAEQLDETLQKNNHEVACAVVVGWFGFTIKGEEAPFSKQHVSELLLKKPSWRDKVLQALEDEAAFLKQSPSTSLNTSTQMPAEQSEARTA